MGGSSEMQISTASYTKINDLPDVSRVIMNAEGIMHSLHRIFPISLTLALFLLSLTACGGATPDTPTLVHIPVHVGH